MSFLASQRRSIESTLPFEEASLPNEPLPKPGTSDKDLATYVLSNWKDHLSKGVRAVSNSELVDSTGKHKANIGRALRKHIPDTIYRQRLAFLQAQNARSFWAGLDSDTRDEIIFRGYANGIAMMDPGAIAANSKLAQNRRARGITINGVQYGSVPEAVVVSFLTESSLQFVPISRQTVQYQPPIKTTVVEKTPLLKRHRFDVRNTSGESFLLDYHIPQIHSRKGNDFDSDQEADYFRNRIKAHPEYRVDVERFLASRYEDRVRTFIAATTAVAGTPFLFASCVSEIYGVFRNDLGIITMPERTFFAEFNRRTKAFASQRAP